MDQHRYSALRARLGGQVPGQRHERNLEEAARTVEDWLETQTSDPGLGFDSDADAEDLRRISALARAGAPEDEVNQAVRRARQHGWAWAPIALLLGETRDQARQRLT
jgi:hypothetical protein